MVFDLNLGWKKDFVTEKGRRYLIKTLVFFLSDFTRCCALYTECLKHPHYKHRDYEYKLEYLWMEYRNFSEISSVNGVGLVHNGTPINEIETLRTAACDYAILHKVFKFLIN